MKFKGSISTVFVVTVFFASISSCSTIELLFVDAIGSADSQFAGVFDFPDGSSNNRGNMHDKKDIEAMDTLNGVVYAVSGDQGQELSSLYMVDPFDGALTLVYNDITDGRNEVVAGSFRPGTSEFWVIIKTVGIAIVDVEQPGYAVVYSSEGHNWDGLAWNPEGDMLYGARNKRIYEYDPFGEDGPVVLANLAPPLTKTIEGIEFDPYGNLIIAAGSSMYRLEGLTNGNVIATQVSDYSGRDIESLTFVPEPATVAILGMGSLLVIRKRR